MPKIINAALASSAILLLTGGLAFAQTPKGGATLAGGDNGAAAKAVATKEAAMPQAKGGSPSAPAGHGQSTEHANGKMRAHKNF